MTRDEAKRLSVGDRVLVDCGTKGTVIEPYNDRALLGFKVIGVMLDSDLKLYYYANEISSLPLLDQIVEEL